MGADECRSRRRGLELRAGVSALQSIGVMCGYHTLHGCGGCWNGIKGGVASYRRPAASAGSKRDVVRVGGVVVVVVVKVAVVTGVAKGSGLAMEYKTRITGRCCVAVDQQWEK